MIQTYEEVGVYSPRESSLDPVVSQLDVRSTDVGFVVSVCTGNLLLLSASPADFISGLEVAGFTVTWVEVGDG